jgi:hypothetical protein
VAADISGAVQDRREATLRVARDSEFDLLSRLAIGAGLLSAVMFVVVGLWFGLQMYGDGAIFSYAVAVRDVWAFHWHNIPGRLTVYGLAMLPAEAYVAWFNDPQGGIVAYGVLFFGIQLAGLAATWLADRSPGRIVFRYACFSTACLCPLVFGFPTETWFAHALFWPTLAICHYARPGPTGAAAIFVAMLALAFTHLGAIIFALTIIATLLLRTDRKSAVPRVLAAFAIVMAIWFTVKAAYPPDDYFGEILSRAALLVFDPEILTGSMAILVGVTLAAYGAILTAVYRFDPLRAHMTAFAAVAAGLAVYWGWFDQSLHADNRYYLRTALLIATPTLGIMAAAYALRADGLLVGGAPWLIRAMDRLADSTPRRIASAAFVLLLLVHAVEAAKFVYGWTQYKDAVRTLANGTLSDPKLGHPQFVSSARIGDDLDRLSWFSTTPYLSVLLAPRLSPARIVVDPDANYFWLDCKTAQTSLDARSAVPAPTRRLIRAYSCLHR